MPLPVSNGYCLSKYEPQLRYIILSRAGLCTNFGVPIKWQSYEPTINQKLKLCICNECWHVVGYETKTGTDLSLDLELEDYEPVIPTPPADFHSALMKPPINAIANGLWIGFLPEQYENLTRTDESCVGLMVLNIYLSSIIGSSRQLMNSHHFVIKNPEPIIRSVPAEVTGTVRTTLVGALTAVQTAIIRKRFPLRVDLCRSFLRWLEDYNACYMAAAAQGLIDHAIFDNLNPDSCFVDRTDSSLNSVNPKLVKILQFGISSYNTGTADNAIEEEEPETGQHETANTELENTRTRMIYQPGTSTVQRASELIIFNTSNLPSIYGMGKLIYCFPTLFPYGCGDLQQSLKEQYPGT